MLALLKSAIISVVFPTLKDSLFCLHQSTSNCTSSLYDVSSSLLMSSIRVVLAINLMIWFVLDLLVQSWVGNTNRSGLAVGTHPWSGLSGAFQWGSPEYSCRRGCRAPASQASKPAAEEWWYYMLSWSWQTAFSHRYCIDLDGLGPGGVYEPVWL